MFLSIYIRLARTRITALVWHPCSPGEFRRPVELGAVLQASRPREDGGDGVGGGGVALLVLPVVPGDGAVRSLGLDGLAVGAHQHGGHQAQGAVALRDHVRLHVAVARRSGR